MKQIQHMLLLAAFNIFSTASFAQAINWHTTEAQPQHMITLHTGFDNAFSFGVGYGYQLNTKMPLLLNIEFSVPGGDKPFDDLKTKIGGQLNVLRSGNFYTTVNAYGIFRRFENEFARMVNFGSEFSLSAGYYRNKWFTAAEFGFDKAIVTHIRHSSLMREYNPGVKDGWYIPTGGNFFYGLKGGYTIKGNDIYAKIGKTLWQDAKTTSTIPYYLQLGVNMKWNNDGRS